MIQSTVRLVISDAHKSDVLGTLRVLMSHATAKAGCVGFSVVQDVADPHALIICELWVSREDFDVHVRSADYRLLLAVIDLSVTPPDISFDDLEHIGGLDLVQALRAPRAPVLRTTTHDRRDGTLCREKLARAHKGRSCITDD